MQKDRRKELKGADSRAIFPRQKATVAFRVYLIWFALHVIVAARHLPRAERVTFNLFISEF